MRAKAETFAQYHDEHARYGGASNDFHALAATFLRSLAEQHGEAKTLVSELETALEAIVCHWDASDDGQVHPGLIDTARTALAKAKSAA